MYVLYTAPIAYRIKPYDPRYHINADDTQIYVYCFSQSQQGLYLVKSKLEECVKHFNDSWMVSYGMKPNQNKTDLLPISSKYHQSPALSYL